MKMNEIQIGMRYTYGSTIVYVVNKGRKQTTFKDGGFTVYLNDAPVVIDVEFIDDPGAQQSVWFLQEARVKDWFNLPAEERKFSSNFVSQSSLFQVSAKDLSDDAMMVEHSRFISAANKEMERAEDSAFETLTAEKDSHDKVVWEEFMHMLYEGEGIDLRNVHTYRYSADRLLSQLPEQIQRRMVWLWVQYMNRLHDNISPLRLNALSTAFAASENVATQIEEFKRSTIEARLTRAEEMWQDKFVPERDAATSTDEDEELVDA